MTDAKKPPRRHASTFKQGDAVELRESATTTKGLVVRVSGDGESVTVKWVIRFGMEDKTSTHNARDLRKVSA